MVKSVRHGGFKYNMDQTNALIESGRVPMIERRLHDRDADKVYKQRFRRLMVVAVIATGVLFLVVRWMRS